MVPTLPAGSADVLVVRAEERSRARRPRLRRPRPTPVEAGDPAAPVPLYVALVLYATREFGDRREADAALAGWQEDAARAAGLVDEAVAVVNRAIRAYRAGAADPYVVEVTRADARAVRVGFGGQSLAAGEWDAAIVLPPAATPRATRADRLRPTEVVADALAGRTRVLDGEDVLLRAVLDIEQGRPDVAARQLALAVDLLLEAQDGPAARLSDAQARAAGVRTALAQDGGHEDAVAQLAELARDIGEAIDAWRAG